MNEDSILIDLYVDQIKLQESLKALRLVALLNEDPALKQLVDLLKVIDATVDTERAKTARSREMEQARNRRQKEEMARMMEQAKQQQASYPWEQPPIIKVTPDIYTRGDTTSGTAIGSIADANKKKPFSLKDLTGNWPGKF